jgi:CheY-like chemotaxis protein
MASLLSAIQRALGETDLPRRETARSRPPVAPGPNRLPAGCLRILVAEDNAVNQKLALRLLEKRGHKVEVVGDGKQALAILERQAFDLVLMDVHMPVLNGFEAVAALRRREADVGGHLPVIALTANAMKGDRERCLEGGFDGYVSKPIDAQLLFAAIGSLAAPAPAEEKTVPVEPLPVMS